MGAVTFGELLDIADAHMLEVTGQLRTPNTGNEEHPATTVALWELTGVLARYTHRVSTSFGLRKNGAAPARRTARLCTHKLRATQDLIGIPPSETGQPPDIARSLHAAGQALGGGLDLLSAHFTVSPRGMTTALTPIADLLVRTESAEWLLHQVSLHADAAFLVVSRNSKGREAADLLREVADLTRKPGAFRESALTAATLPLGIGTAETAPARGDLIELRMTERRPPVSGEDRAQTTAGIDASIQRIMTAAPPDSLRTWRYLATASAMTTEISGLILRHLAKRARALQGDASAEAILAAELAVSDLRDGWADVAGHWRDVVCEGIPTGQATDAGDLVVRLGRLLYADPAWMPGPNARLQIKKPEGIAPTLDDIRHLTATLSRAVGACDRAAGTAVLHQLNNKPLRVRTAEGTRTREPAGHSPLINAYGNVQLYGLHAKTTFSTALAALDVPASAAAFHLADADFPTHITAALHSTRTGAEPSRAAQSPTTKARTA